MEHHQKIEFEKVRNFNELFSDTFTFVRNELKQLLKMMFIYVFPFALIVGIISGLVNIAPFSFNPELMQGFSYLPYSGMELIILYAVMIIFGVMLRTVPNAYIKAYLEEGHSPDEQIIKKYIWPFFKKFLGLTLLLILIPAIVAVPTFMLTFSGSIGMGIFLGFVLTPLALYFMITMIFCIPSIAFEEQKVIDAPKRSFFLIKGKWWFTFGILLLLGIIIQVVNFIFSIPQVVIVVVNSILFINESTESGYFGLTVIIIASAISSLGYVSTLIIDVFNALHFFNMRERKEACGLTAKVDSLAAKLEKDMPEEKNESDNKDDGEEDKENPERFMPKDI